MSDEHAKLVIPGLLQQGAQNLKDHDPLVFKRLSWQHIDILTAPCRDRIKELEKQAKCTHERSNPYKHAWKCDDCGCIYGDTFLGEG